MGSFCLAKDSEKPTNVGSGANRSGRKVKNAMLDDDSVHVYIIPAVSICKGTDPKGEDKVGAGRELGPDIGTIDRRATVVEALRRQLAAQRAEWFERTDSSEPRKVSTGLPSLDRLLPGGGVPERGLIECLGEAGSGVGSTALLLASHLIVDGGICVVLDSVPSADQKGKKTTWEGNFFKPGTWSQEFDCDSFVLVQVRSRKDLFWAFDQVLRAPGAIAVGWFDEIPESTYRRFLLATEEHGTSGVLIRPPVMKERPAWADLRLAVEPVADDAAGENDRRTIGIRVLHCRGSCVEHRRAEVHLSYGTRVVPVSAGTVAETPFPVSFASGSIG